VVLLLRVTYRCQNSLRQLSLSESQSPILKPASISGGILAPWAGKYRALVDGHASSHINGSTCLVQPREHEDVLRVYETDNYEVVRWTILMDGRKSGDRHSLLLGLLMLLHTEQLGHSSTYSILHIDVLVFLFLHGIMREPVEILPRPTANAHL